MGEFLCNVIQMCMLAKSCAERLSRELWKCQPLLITSLPDRTVCTCILRWSAWKVYLCHMVGKFCLSFFFCTLPFTVVALEWSASHRFNKPLSVYIRFKATKPQGSRAAAACGAKQWLQIWSHRTRRCEGVTLMKKRKKRSGVYTGFDVVIRCSGLNMIKYYNTKEYF